MYINEPEADTQQAGAQLHIIFEIKYNFQIFILFLVYYR